MLLLGPLFLLSLRCFPFANAFYGLFSGWRHEENTKDLGMFSSGMKIYYYFIPPKSGKLLNHHYNTKPFYVLLLKMLSALLLSTLQCGSYSSFFLSWRSLHFCTSLKVFAQEAILVLFKSTTFCR